VTQYILGQNIIGYTISISVIITNASDVPIYTNGVCTSVWERYNAGAWVEVSNPPPCLLPKQLLKRIAPGATGVYGLGRGAGGPGQEVPDFAKPGAYRIRMILFRDQYGHNRMPERFGYSNEFTVRSN
jgi:hypothetical protein